MSLDDTAESTVSNRPGDSSPESLILENVICSAMLGRLSTIYGLKIYRKLIMYLHLDYLHKPRKLPDSQGANSDISVFVKLLSGDKIDTQRNWYNIIGNKTQFQFKISYE